MPSRRGQRSHPTATPRKFTSSPTGSLVSQGISSIAGLKSFSGDSSIDEIVFADGTYAITNAGGIGPNSLWIGGTRAGGNWTARTRPLVIRPTTPWGATFSGSGGGSGKWMAFMEGAHDITWQTPVMANCTVASDGVFKFGGDPTYAPAHHITIDNPRVLQSCSGSCNPGGAAGAAAGASASALEHAFYFAHALTEGPHHINIISPDVDARGGLASAVHVFHSSPTAPGPHDVTISGMVVQRTQQAIMFWDRTMFNWLIDGGTITDEYRWALSYANNVSGDGASGTPSGLVVQNVTDSGTHSAGYSGGHTFDPLGDSHANPSAGITLIGGNI